MKGVLHRRHPPDCGHGVIVSVVRRVSAGETHGRHYVNAHAFSASAHSLGADEEQLSLRDLDYLSRVRIVCDGDVRVTPFLGRRSGSRTPNFAQN